MMEVLVRAEMTLRTLLQLLPPPLVPLRVLARLGYWSAPGDINTLFRGTSFMTRCSQWTIFGTFSG